MWHPVDLAQPDHAVPPGQHPPEPMADHAGLPSGHRVVALREVDGMPHLPPGAGKSGRASHPGGSEYEDVGGAARRV